MKAKILKLHGISKQMLSQSLELVSFVFGFEDYLLATLSAACTFLYLCYGTGVVRTYANFEVWLGAVFVWFLYLMFRMFVPWMISITIGDGLRYRFTFHLLYLTGVAGVVLTPAFRVAFDACDILAFSLSVSMVSIGILLAFLRLGGVFKLCTPFFLAGGVAGARPSGFLTIGLLIFCLYLVQYKTGIAKASATSEDIYGDEYYERMDLCQNRLSFVHDLGLLNTALFVAGFAGVVCARIYCKVGTHITFEAVVDYFKEYALSAALNLGGSAGIALAGSGLLLLFTVYYIRRVTDAARPMPVHLIVVFMMLLLTAFGHLLGVTVSFPLFKDAMFSPVHIFTSIVCAYVFILCAAAFLVDICCREHFYLENTEDSFSEFMNRFPNSFSPSKRRTRQIVVVSFGVAFLVAVIIVPLFLRGGGGVFFSH